MRPACVLLLLMQMLAASPAWSADAISRVREAREIRMGYFEGSAPFSATGKSKAPEGYSVELCERVAAGIQRQLGLAELKRVWVPLGLGDRIEAVRSGRIDIECGTTTWSLSRQQLVDFSLMIFIDGASLLVSEASDMRRMPDAAGKRIAVIRNTTTERALQSALKKKTPSPRQSLRSTAASRASQCSPKAAWTHSPPTAACFRASRERSRRHASSG